MRKQTKLVAVLSAAALFAIGASMTSFAATKGWTQEGDTWVYLNSSGERVTEEWKRSGNNYYWLDENGEMAKSQIIESSDNYYYVDDNGARVTNQWVSIENEDDETVDGKEVDVLWYYLGTSGRAYKADDADMYKNSLIGGKRYFFDEEARMVSGWTTTNLSTESSSEYTYYLGEDNEGWARTGWQYLEIPEDIEGDYDVDEAWFYFKDNGRARKSERVYIKNAYYAFDDNGVLLDDWQRASDTVVSTPADIKLNNDDQKTFYNLETGNQGSGWIYTYEDDDESGDEKWFYLESNQFNTVFNNNGKDAGTKGTSVWKLKEGNVWDGGEKVGCAAKVIKGKTYLFDSKGRMLTGVFAFYGNGVKRTGGVDLERGIYYFNKSGGSAEGRMETGRTTVDYDGEKYTYYFNKAGQACRLTLNDGAVYDGFGVRVEAGDGNANQIYSISDLLEQGSEYRPSGLDRQQYFELGKFKYDKGTIIVSSTGKIRTGTVTIDDVKYEIKNYVVNKAYDKSDKDIEITNFEQAHIYGE